jgi:hypothetical protein
MATTCYAADCDEPVDPASAVTDPGDPLGRTWHSAACADRDSEAAYEQQYPSGVAT